MKLKSKAIPMHNKFTAASILILLFHLNCFGMEENRLTREEIVELLPRSIEGDAPGERENFKKLVDAGELAYEALSEELLQSNDAYDISSITTAFEQSKGNKAIPLQAMTDYIKIHGREAQPNSGMESVLMAMGALGGSKEISLLREYLDIKDRLLQSAVEANIERIEKRLKNEERTAAKASSSNDRRNGISVESNPEKEGRSTNGEVSGPLPVSFWQWLAGGAMVVVVLLIFWQGFAKPKAG